ncbi:type 2 lantipeptide synthetase LanM family protein [Myxococcus sp. K15C18031901]|uniref:type 2 lanthipeptide synthetase LanM family protein n=1 Tax=Myxococcus dinghuensis TaxID=2906761 RepID=UPI0020A8207B|nr:type 2 lanthipeptide synthetase LanM family protein [Myxococcus dinghuensis]MCP3100113.1 type 2 lantipeptide synthetase LanM family protein [Myxococcus dinghuensis]
MSQSQPDPAWYPALTLAERIATLRASPDTPGPVDEALARRRLERWREKPPLSDDARFAWRLRDAGIDEGELLRLLGEPPEALRARVPQPPAWMRDIEEALALGLPTTSLPYPESFLGTPNAALRLAAEPFLHLGYTRLQEGIARLKASGRALPFDPDTVGAVLFASLPGPMVDMLSRTLVLELHVARLSGLLEGATPPERFQFFVRRLRTPEVLAALYREYPVLARQLVTRVGLWVDTGLEFLERLCADWTEVRPLLGAAEPGPLTELKAGMGDVHRGGRSVMRATFASGQHVIYKPRSLQTDHHFHALLEWVNAKGISAPFPRVPHVEREGHGWVQYVEALPCADEAQVRRFYQRQGGYLALLYLLEGTDFHFENVIARGEEPILVDLESLLHPPLRLSEQSDLLLREQEMFASVLRVGLLPGRAWEDARSAGVDISGMGNPEGQAGNRNAPAVEGAGTDQLHYTRKPRAFRRGLNRPTLQGMDVDLFRYQDSVVRGFTEVYELLRAHRDTLVRDWGLLERFARVEVRTLLRPTFVYKTMLLESHHPDLLRNALDRDRFFERLGLNTDRFPFLSQVGHAERRALERGDVPLFTTRPDGRGVWGEAHEEIPDVFDERGLDRLEQQLGRLSERDRDKQVWAIRASFATLAIEADPLRLATHAPVEAAAPLDRTRLLDAARAVGDRLELLSVGGQEECSWFGLTLGLNRQWRLSALGLDLYGGLPGVALFLAHLGELTGEARYTQRAWGAVRTMLRKQGEPRHQPASVGGFLGWGGLVYTYARLGALWSRPDLLDTAASCAAQLDERLSQDGNFDLLDGAAGSILALAALHHVAPSDAVLAVARRCGEHLLTHARPQARGLGWYSRLEPDAALTGLAHGASGIAQALLTLHGLTGEQRFRDAGLKAVDYERSLFVPERSNWPDLRGRPVEPRFKTSWCHGSTGIGLSRLATLAHLDDALVHQEVDAALHDTLSQGLGRDHSPCHGDAGSLELLLASRERPGRGAAHPELERWGATLVASGERHGWLSGVPLGVETPGFMVGLAGTGYTLLRLAEPARVPSVLVLEPPRRRVS